MAAGTHRRAITVFVVSLMGLAVSAAALVLLVPSFFDGGSTISPWVVAGLACLAVAFAVGTLLSGPAHRASDRG